MRTSGGADYEHRLDFTFIRDRIAAGGLQWVYYRGPDRVARDQLSAYSFYGFLEATDTDLYLIPRQPATNNGPAVPSPRISVRSVAAQRRPAPRTRPTPNQTDRTDGRDHTRPLDNPTPISVVEAG